MKDEGRAAGRGVFLIAGAKLIFITSSYGVQLALPRLLGSTEEFGLFAAAMNLASMVNNLLVASTIQSVSKWVSEDDASAPETLRQALGGQAVVGVTLGGGMLLAAPWIATDLLLDRELTPLLRLAAGVIFAYALYATLVGSLNGRRRFARQAGLDITFSLLRTTGMIGGAALGLGAVGVMGGFAGAALAILVVAGVAVGVGRGGGRAPWRRWVAFMLPLWLYQACLNGVLQVDLAVLKRTVAELSLAAGQDAIAAASVASARAGLYRAAQTFAFVPYQLVLAVTFIVFPLVSKATSGGDEAGARATIERAMRFSLLVLLAVAAPIAGASEGVLRIAYPDAYLAGSGALEVLVLGMVAFTLFVVSATVLTGAGRPGLAASIAGISFVVVIAANRLFIGLAGLDGDTPRAAALGTSVGTLLAMTLAGFAVRRGFGAWISPLTAIRALLAGGLGFGVARIVPHGSAPGALSALVAGALAYALALVLLRELGREDLRLVRRLLGR